LCRRATRSGLPGATPLALRAAGPASRRSTHRYRGAVIGLLAISRTGTVAGPCQRTCGQPLRRPDNHGGSIPVFRRKWPTCRRIRQEWIPWRENPPCL